MSDETIVAVYDTPAHAQAAVAALRAASVPESAISTHAGTGSLSGAATTAAPREEGFWSSLFGGSSDTDTAVYDRSMASGSTVVTVKVPDTHAARVMDILESQNPIDIDERATGYGLGQATTTTTQTTAVPVMPAAPVARTAAPVARTAATGGDTIQLSEESLAVGKRLVNNGGTRIRRYVVETPVQQDVTLRSEKVELERRPVTDGRPVTDSFSEKTVEMLASGEEAVVGKTSRVVEEVGLRKESTERTETVRDTVRKEEVAVEQIPAQTTTTGTTPVTPFTPKV